MSNELNLFRFHDFLQGSISCIIKEIGIPKTVIEIGVFQGYFTFNMTNSIASKFPDYRHFAIDPFTVSDDLEKTKLEDAFNIFKNNLQHFPYSNNIHFINKTAWDGMIDLYNKGIQADLIYIDGDHKAREVLSDMVLGFKLLRLGGAMLCDDSVTWMHVFKDGLKPLDYSPRLAVDSFIQCNWSVVEPIILPNGYQSAFIKRRN